MDSEKYVKDLARQRDQAVIDAEQRMAATANPDLREACRQYYWPHRSFTGPVAEQIKVLDRLDPHKRDVVMTAHGYPKDLIKKL